MIVKYLKKLQKSIENDRELQKIVENCSSALAAPRPDCVFFFPRHRSRRREGQSCSPSLLEQFTSQQLIFSQEIHNRIVRRGH